MGMDLSQGGHLTHGSPVNMSGKNYNFVSYGVSAEDGRIDYAALAKQVAKVRPKLLVAGASAYPRAIDFEKLAEIAHGYGAMLMVDMAHIAGLVAGGQHQSPVPYADVVTTTTHKTLRGPRGGLILTNNAVPGKRINSAIFPGTQGGPLEHVIAAKAVCFGEALKPEFKEYARKIVENAKALGRRADRPRREAGFRRHRQPPAADRPDRRGCTGKELEHNLDEVHITANKNTVPGEKRSPFVTSGVRAIPHNSKCRYGERGAAAAKPKAQIILDAAKVSAASGGNSEPKQGQRSQSARGFCPRSTMRVPQPDIIEHFGNADAVPQPPERCLSRQAGIVRCCLTLAVVGHGLQALVIPLPQQVSSFVVQVVILLVVQQKAVDDDILARRTQQNALGRQPVAPGTACLLVIVLPCFGACCNG